jgi:hypothetical protein
VYGSLKRWCPNNSHYCVENLTIGDLLNTHYLHNHVQKHNLMFKKKILVVSVQNPKCPSEL